MPTRPQFGPLNGPNVEFVTSRRAPDCVPEIPPPAAARQDWVGVVPANWRSRGKGGEEVGDVGPARLGLAVEAAQRVAEAQDARVELGRQADLVAEARGQVPPAPAELAGEVADPRSAVGRAQDVPGPRDARGRRARGREAPGQQRVERAEARLPAAGVRQPLRQAGERAGQVLERDHLAGEHAHRHPEDHRGAQRSEVDLDAVLPNCRAAGVALAFNSSNPPRPTGGRSIHPTWSPWSAQARSFGHDTGRRGRAQTCRVGR